MFIELNEKVAVNVDQIESISLVNTDHSNRINIRLRSKTESVEFNTEIKSKEYYKKLIDRVGIASKMKS